MEERRRLLEQRIKKKGKKKEVCEDVGRVLGVSSDWWGTDSGSSDDDSDSEEDEEVDEGVYVSELYSYTDPLTQSPLDSSPGLLFDARLLTSTTCANL